MTELTGPEAGTSAGVAVTRNDAASRYEVHEDGVLAGFAEIQTTPTMVVFTHTEVLPAFECRGLASRLVRWALDDVRSQELRVLPICPYVQAFITKHPEYADLDYRST